MSDIEARCLKTTSSICSDVDQDTALGVRSVSSINFMHHHLDSRQTTPTMNSDSGFTNLRTGQQKPPHYHRRNDDQDDGKPLEPLKKQPLHPWSFDPSEFASGDARSPKINSHDIVQFSVTGTPPRSDSSKRLLQDDVIREDDEMETRYKNARSKDRKKKKHHRKKQHENESEVSLGMHEVGTSYSRSQSEQPGFVALRTGQKHKSKRQSQQSSKKPHDYSSESAVAYIGGNENPAYDRTETSERTYMQNEYQEQREKSLNDQAGLTKSTDVVALVNSSLTNTIPSSNAMNKARTMQTGNLTSLSPETRQNVNQNVVAMYISNNIEQRECCSYVRNGKSASDDCVCGSDVQWHKERRIRVDHNTEHVIWHMKTHTKTSPCDSFGEIYFRGFGTETPNSPYVRVDSMTDIEKVWTVLTKYWHLPYPKLLISVTGGAKRFYLRPRLKTILKQGLVNAAVSTGAWLITGGTATGVMEFVGEAVQDHIKASGSKANDCVALGVASWGAVTNNVSLDGELGVCDIMV